MITCDLFVGVVEDEAETDGGGGEVMWDNDDALEATVEDEVDEEMTFGLTF